MHLSFTPPSQEYEKEFREKLHEGMHPVDTSENGPRIIKLQPVDMAELMKPPQIFSEDDPDLIIEEMFPPSPISGIPFTPVMRGEDPMEEMFREMADPLGMAGPLGGGLTIDTVEEKISADGSHHRKEVHNDHGHRSVTITEEKDIGEVAGATSP